MLTVYVHNELYNYTLLAWHECSKLNIICTSQHVIGVMYNIIEFFICSYVCSKCGWSPLVVRVH